MQYSPVFVQIQTPDGSVSYVNSDHIVRMDTDQSGCYLVLTSFQGRVNKRITKESFDNLVKVLVHGEVK